VRKLSRYAPLLIAMLLIASCGKGSAPASSESGPDTAVPASDRSGEPASKPEPVTVKYYVTDDGMYGLIEKQTAVEPEDPEDVYRLAIEALKLGDEAAKEYSLWKNAIFRRVELTGGVLTVDLSLPGEARLGSAGESLAVEAITRTAFQFDEVEALEILVDGEQVESLMGHETLAHPIKRGAYPDDLNFRTSESGQQ
jgi:spore germination protein GerM